MHIDPIIALTIAAMIALVIASRIVMERQRRNRKG